LLSKIVTEIGEVELEIIRETHFPLESAYSRISRVGFVGIFENQKSEDFPMKPEYFEHLVRWFREEREAFQSAVRAAKSHKNLHSFSSFWTPSWLRITTKSWRNPDFVNEIPQGAVTQQGALTITKVFERFWFMPPRPITGYQPRHAKLKESTPNGSTKPALVVVGSDDRDPQTGIL
jgi:hypothetical protein